jgi:hypothetical protein
VSGRDAPALFDLIEERLDQVAVAVEIGAEADRVLAIALRRDVRPTAPSERKGCSRSYGDRSCLADRAMVRLSCMR